jgi:hypothetical protein
VNLIAQVHVRAIMGDYLLQILHPLRPKAVHIELRPRGTRADEGEVGVPPVGGESDGDIAGVMGGASDERWRAAWRVALQLEVEVREATGEGRATVADAPLVC